MIQITTVIISDWIIGLTTLIIETGKNDIFYVKTALEYCPKLINLKISPGNHNHSETKTPFDDTLRYINQ